ncbi:ribonuclease H-like domain-containing protein [Tanacetum coccineum]
MQASKLYLEEEPAPTGETSAPPAPKTAKQLAARRNQERVKSILLLAIPDEYLLKFHNVVDAKSLQEAIKSSLDKAYDRFQKLISQLEVHGAPISKEDINQKFLRSLPPSWNQIALIMRNKPDIDEIDIDDLYNNLRVYEDEMKRSSSSTSTSQNLAFLSFENTSSTNEVSTASGDFGVSTAGGISQVPSTPCAHDAACSFFAQPTTSPQLENEDFQQIDEDDLEELDLRWQVAMLTVRVRKFIQKTGRNMDFKEKRPVSLDKSKIECYNCHRKGHFARECRSGRNQGKRSYGDNGRSNAPTNESSSQALVAQDGLGGYDWSNDFEIEPVNYALMAISSSSSSSSSDNEVQKCSKQCLESFKTLQKNYDSEREKHSRARLEIQGYELALESLESRILVHEKNELAWGEKYEFQNYELKCREIKINNLNLELEKVVKERDELKLKIEKWEESSKNLDELLNSQMSARDKTGLGYGTQLNEMSNNSETDSEISLSVFDVRSSDEESTPANDRFSKADGYHAVPPPITGNFLTPRADISFAGLDEYAIRKKIIESKTTDLNTKTSETVGKTNEANTQKPKTVYESVNRDKVIIEDWNSDDEDDVSEVQTVSPVKTNETQTVKTRVDKIGQTSQKQGIGFKKIKACFVCKTSRRTFVPSGVLNRTSLVNPVRPNEKRAVQTINTARPVSTARSVSTARQFAPIIAQTGSAIRPIYLRMDNVRPRASYSPIRRSYYTKPAFRPKNLKQDVKTFGIKNMTTAGTRAVVNTGKGKMENDLKKSRWVWRPKGNYMDHESKENGSFMLKKFEYGNPEIFLQDHAVVDSGCSSHMTGNKAYLSDYEDYNRGFVAFGSDPKGDELKFNLFSISQMCDKKNSVLFTDTECLIMSPSFKLLNESQVVLRAPRKDDVYSLDLKNIVPSEGKNFSGKVTPLFDSMLVQQTEDEGKASERPSDSQPIPSPPHPSEDQPQTQTDPSPIPSPSISIPDSNPEGSGGNHGGQSSNDTSLSGNEDGLTLQSVYDLCVSLCQHVTAQAKEIEALKAQVKKLKKGVKPLITHHKAWMKSVTLNTRLARKTSLKKMGVQKGYVSKQGRKSVKSSKGEPSMHKDPNFEDLDDFVDVDDTLDYIETEDDQDEGMTSYVVLEEKESADKEVSTEAPVSTVKPNESTNKRNEGTDKQDGGTDSTKDRTDRQGEGTR